ncbi:phenylacetate-CoA ligase [Ardenticatena maritima]|uniref:Phenylacetate-CoA ligase n=2 Tax=Ardenticatena maritima TaxID=872965 RepID=A0A0M9UDC3_9CHLR|nr:AMP-binding protein [Ardenticatena maritima]GAP63817.1 phenylacetate-CoA ligase [Ardenticatena maritima]
MSESRFYLPRFEAMPPEQWSAYQDDLVRRTITYAAAHVPEVQQRLAAAGLRAEDIHGVADLAAIPLLDKDNLPALQAANPPFGGMLAVPVEQLKRIYMSPGPILDPEGDRPDYWRWAAAFWAAGFRRGDIVINTFAYHFTPAGAMFDSALRALGCVVVPTGPGNTEWQLDVLAQTQAVGYVGTPDFLKILLEKAAERGITTGLRRAYVSAAPLPPSLRAWLAEQGVATFQGYGTADVGAIGYECEAQDGWHIAPDIVVEIVDPESGQPLPAGEKGEVVVTRADTAYPLVRFATGDLSAFHTEPCTCGRTTPRLVGFLGRVGEAVKVRGMFVRPRQIARALEGFPVARFQAVISRAEHRDTLTVRVEPHPNATLDTDAIAATLRETLKLRADVVVVPHGTLHEESPLLVDERTWE